MLTNPYVIKSSSVENTYEIATSFAKYVQPETVITLEGDLGVGKTAFTQGLARGLGITKIVNSPTFTIIKEYKGKLPLYHMDVYRLKDAIDDLGFEEYFYGNGVTVIEWASIIQEFLPDDYLNIRIERMDGDDRKLTFEPIGIRYDKLCEEFFKNENLSN